MIHNKKTTRVGEHIRGFGLSAAILSG